MTREPSEPARDCHNCNNVGCPGCNEDLRRQFGEVLRRWGLLDEVNNPKDAEEFAVTDLLSIVAAETARLREKHKASLRRADKVNNELMEEVQRYAIGAERPVLWSVYNRMHSRAAHAEAALNRVGRIARRLAAHAVGFKDALDASDHGPWGRTVGADIAELIEALPDQPATSPARESLIPGACGHHSPEGHLCNRDAGHFGYHRRTQLDGDLWTSWVGELPEVVEEEQQRDEPGDGDRIVAYRAPVSNNLYCAPCGESNRSMALTSKDLPDGGTASAAAWTS